MIKTVKQIERSKRDEAIRIDYLKEMGSNYIKGVNQKGSSAVVYALSKKFNLTPASIYNALKQSI